MKPRDSIFKGVLLAYLVLFLHVILILGLGLVMLLFGGVVTYLPWILAIGGLLIVGSAYLWWRHLKRQGKKIRDVLNDPLFHGRSVEISFLGGFASLKVGHSPEPPAITQGPGESVRQLQSPESYRSEQLANLARLLKEELITTDEFLQAKKELLGK
jgi:hypothetical protein